MLWHLFGSGRIYHTGCTVEWGEHDVTTEHWLQSYSDAVAAMRKAGFTTTLVVDAPGWGQNIRPILEGGRQLIKLYGNLYKI